MKRYTQYGILRFFNSNDLAFEKSGESSFKLDFSKDNSKESDSYNLGNESYGVSSLILLFLLFLFSNFLSS